MPIEINAAPHAGRAAFLAAHNADVVARRGELVDTRAHPALVALNGDRLVGVLTYIVDGAVCEILTLHTDERGSGIGTALVDAAARVAVERGCSRLNVTTTNDNVDALRFYQRRGFRIAALRAGAVDESRDTLKPQIPEIGDHGIPLRDELELVRDLDSQARP